MTVTTAIRGIPGQRKALDFPVVSLDNLFILTKIWIEWPHPNEFRTVWWGRFCKGRHTHWSSRDHTHCRTIDLLDCSSLSIVAVLRSARNWSWQK